MELIKFVRTVTFEENNLEKSESYSIYKDGDNYYRQDYYSYGRESPLYLVKPIAVTTIDFQPTKKED